MKTLKTLVFLLVVMTPSFALAQAPVVTSATSLGTPALDAGVAARDLGGAPVALGTTTAYFYGDTLGMNGGVFHFESNSWGTGTDPLHVTTVTDATGVPVQVIPFTAAEAAYNADPSHVDRWALYIFGAIPDVNGALDLWYGVMKVNQTLGGFYAEFPIQRIGVALLLKGASQAFRWSEQAWPNAYPTGFHRGTDGLTHFWLEYVSDSQPQAPMVPARVVSTGIQVWNGSGWTATIADGHPTFAMDAVVGISATWNPHYGAYLLTYVNSTGTLQLRTIATETGTPSAAAAVVAIPGWTTPWNGYGGFQVGGTMSSDGTSFDVLYSSLVWIFSNVRQVYRVTVQ